MVRRARKHTWPGIAKFSLYAGVFGAAVALVIACVMVREGWIEADVLDMYAGIGLAFVASFAVTFSWLLLWLLSERLRNGDGS